LDREGVSSDGNLAEELNKLFNKLETQESNAVSAAGVTESLGITDGWSLLLMFPAFSQYSC